MPFKHTMITVEKLPLADAVAEKGLTLAQAIAAKATLLHINPPALLYSTNSQLSAAEVSAQLRQRADALLRDIVQPFTKSGQITCQVSEGGVEAEILAAIAALQPDLLVLGTHARKPWQDMLLGNIAEDLVRHSQCPVMLIRASEQEMT